MTRRRKLVFVALGLLVVALVVGFIVRKQLASRPSYAPALVPADWSAVRDSPGHALHVGQQKLACNNCHTDVDGGFSDKREKACVSCHAKETAKTHVGNATTPSTCLTCHAFAAAPAPTCLTCHASPQGTKAAVAVHIGSPCATCHNPHREKPAADAQPACTTCHADQAGALVHANGKGKCADCHAPHARAVVAELTCKGCHANAPQEAKPSGHPACVTCHTPHNATLAAVKPCLGCHEDKHTAITANHTACTTCHAPHTAEKPSTCLSCHKSQVTLGAPRIAAHAECASCHNPHNPKASPAASCTTCHAMAVKHAPGGANTCTTCHAMHPARGATTVQIALACTSCHKKAPTDIARHPKGMACIGCHAPHTFALAKATGAFCSKCHANEAKVALASKGHADCTSCHGDIHEPSHGPACATCHAAEASTAPLGHRACVNCHEPHDGRIKPSASTCQSCHAKEAKTKHGELQGGCTTCHRAHGASGPHAPPGAMTPPACTTCHAAAKLPGLHQTKIATPPGKTGHEQCASCHTSHGPIKADRATCTTCHEKQKDHQPAAKACNGCHIFGGP